MLAGLRFVLAMVVVSGHLSWFAPHGQALLLADWDGTAAVLGFLVISGYSIAHSLGRQPRGFYRRRVLRIYPLYAAAIVLSLLPFARGAMVLSAPGLPFQVARPTWPVVVGNLLLVQNLVCPTLSSDLPLWTLGIEVACYLIAPRLRRWPVALQLAVAAVSAAAFMAYPSTGLPHYRLLLWGLLLLFFAWAWLGGFVLHRYADRGPWAGTVLGIVGAAALGMNHADSAWHPIVTFAGATLVVTLAPKASVWPPLGRVLNFLGDLSYPLYLMHVPAFHIGFWLLGVREPVSLLAIGLAVSAVALGGDVALKAAVSRRVPRADVPTRPSTGEEESPTARSRGSQ